MDRDDVIKTFFSAKSHYICVREFTMSVLISVALGLINSKPLYPNTFTSALSCCLCCSRSSTA